MAEKMDREEAAAFIHVSVTWRRQSESEKLDWCGRAARIISQGFTQGDIGQFCGVSRQVIGERLSWSEALLKTADSAKLDSLKREASIKRAERGLKQAAKTDPEQAAELFVEAVGVDAAIDAVSKAAGATRSGSPKTNVDDIFGPFVKVRNALGNLRRTLPDYTAGSDIADEAQDTIGDLEGTAQIIRSWLKGSDVADEVEAFLKEAAR